MHYITDYSITNFSILIFEKSVAAAAAVVQLQQQYFYKSIQNVKLLTYTRFSDNKWIHINIYSICSCSGNCSCSCSDAAARLQLQRQYPFESIQNVKQPLCTKFGDNREKIEDYLRFLTHAGETRFPIFAWGNLRKLCHFVIFMGLMLTLTLKIV